MPNSARESFIRCLLELAENETNPVLQVISCDKAVEENKKYPADLLQFNQSGWRAYYHCHPATRAGNHNFPGEHGHFHIFVRTKNEPEEWAHLVALAMDDMGQPLGWFTVNQWVTGESWQDAELLADKLRDIPYDSQTELTECWLLSLLSLDKNSVRELLKNRDKILNKMKNLADGIDIRQNKDIYLLSETTINLKEQLQ